MSYHAHPLEMMQYGGLIVRTLSGDPSDHVKSESYSSSDVSSFTSSHISNNLH